MARNVTLQLPALYPKQRSIFYCDERIGVCEATTKAGKSVGALHWLSSLAAVVVASYLWVSPVFPQAKVMHERLKRMYAKADPHKTSGWKSNDTELWIMVPGGARIWFKGSDRPDTIYGSDYAAAVIDEASRCKADAYHAVMSTLTATNGPLRIIGNVRGRQNWAYRLARKAEAGEPGMRYSKLRAADAVDAGIIKQETVADAKRLLPPAVFRELYEAEASDDGSCPFDLAAIDRCICPLSTSDPACWGVDLAKSHDWTVAIALDAQGRACHVERWQSDWAQTQMRLVGLIGDTPALIDSTGVGDPIVEKMQTLCGAVQGYKFTSSSKQTLMVGLASAIQTETIGFPDGVVANELRSFAFEYTASGVRYSAPEGMHDDCVCALALAAQCMHVAERSAFDFRVV